MKPPRHLVSRTVRSTVDVRAFFDEAAADYQDLHGRADRALRLRLNLLVQLLPRDSGGVLVEIGCGTAMHLLALAGGYDQAIGLDLSSAMIRRCEAQRRHHPLRDRLRFAVDAAEELLTLHDGSVDALICVGAIEHMPDKPRVAAQIHRVLKSGGTFVCLTPNGGYCWYTHLAPALGLETRHLSTDRFLGAADWLRLLEEAGFRMPRLQYWSFIPRGDMPWLAARLLEFLDRVGSALGLARLRGGLALKAVKMVD